MNLNHSPVAIGWCILLQSIEAQLSWRSWQISSRYITIWATLVHIWPRFIPWMGKFKLWDCVIVEGYFSSTSAGCDTDVGQDLLWASGIAALKLGKASIIICNLSCSYKMYVQTYILFWFFYIIINVRSRYTKTFRSNYRSTYRLPAELLKGDNNTTKITSLLKDRLLRNTGEWVVPQVSSPDPT